MSATQLIFTQTHLDTIVLKQKLAFAFFERGDFRQIEKVSEDNQIADNWHKYLNSGQILEPNFSKKVEFREQQNSWYQSYNLPTLFF